MKSQKAKITGYKIKNSKKKGYKELTFTVKWTAQWNVKSGEVHKIANTDDTTIGGYHYYAVVDYNIGKGSGKITAVFLSEMY
ncbi:MAG: hypothetical protein ACI4C5_02155 [Lachnospiraceae bacterium]